MSKIVIYYIDKQTKKRENICSFPNDGGKLDDNITNSYIADEINKKFPNNFAIRSSCTLIAASLTGYGYAQVNQYKFGIEV